LSSHQSKDAERKRVVLSTEPIAKGRKHSSLTGDQSSKKAPPPVSIDTLKPTPSLKPPPPVGAPVAGTAKEKTSLRPWLWLAALGVVALLVAGGVASIFYFGFTSDAAEGQAAEAAPAAAPATAESTPAPPEETAPGAAEPAAPAAVVSTPKPAPAEPSSPAPEVRQPSAPRHAAPDASVQSLVDSFTINMVRNRGAKSMIVVDSVVYPLGAVLEPSSGLFFAGFSDDGKRLVFQDARGARYERAL